MSPPHPNPHPPTALTSSHPNFLPSYFAKSRLHHLSTWKSSLLLTNTQKYTPAQDPLKTIIMHIDLDGFFVNASLLSKPIEWKKQPCAVAHSAGSTSELASANYPARKYGIKNGMGYKQAIELCPTLKILPYDFALYEKLSNIFYQILRQNCDYTQPVSCDEALVDVTDAVTKSLPKEIPQQSLDAELRARASNKFAQHLRTIIFDETGLTASIGAGPTPLHARLATHKAKPNGQYTLFQDGITEFMQTCPIIDLPGVGSSIASKLCEELNIEMVADLLPFPKSKLQHDYGTKTGEMLYNFARGIDERTLLQENIARKSIGADVNWGIRFERVEQVETFFKAFAEELETRLTDANSRGKMVTLKIKQRHPTAPKNPPKFLGHGYCLNLSKSVALDKATRNKDEIFKAAWTLYKDGIFVEPEELRGIGIALTKLEDSSDKQLEGRPADQPKLSFLPQAARFEEPSPLIELVRDPPLLPWSQITPAYLLSLKDEERTLLLRRYVDEDVKAKKTADSPDLISDLGFRSQDTDKIIEELPDYTEQEKLDIEAMIEQESLDRTVVNTLPYQLVMEMLRDHQSRAARVEEVNRTPQKAPRNLLMYQPSPSKSRKLQSPRVSRAGHANHIGASPSRRNTRPQLHNHIHPQPETEPHHIPIIPEARPPMPANTSNPLQVLPPDLAQPRFQGTSDFEEIRDMISDWVEYFDEGPMLEDSEAFAKYLMALTKRCCFERLEAVLIHFRDCVKHRTQWDESWRAILTSVQTTMQSCWNRTLNLEHLSLS